MRYLQYFVSTVDGPTSLYSISYEMMHSHKIIEYDTISVDYILTLIEISDNLLNKVVDSNKCVSITISSATANDSTEQQRRHIFGSLFRY